MLQTLYEQRGELAVYDTRDIRPGYCEFVVYSKDLHTWESRFTAACGGTVKPAGSKPSPEHLNLTSKYGGIERNQMLYCKQDKGRLHLIMLWPWHGGEYVTVKMVEKMADSDGGDSEAAPLPGAVAKPSKKGGRLRKVLIIVLVAVIGLIAASALAINIAVGRIEQMLGNITVENIDPHMVADGVYEGTYNAWAVSARVSVLVRDGRIEGIELLEHRHGPNYGADSITQRIVERQALDVDAVSGATSSSDVIRKAVELALRKGVTQPAAVAAESVVDTVAP